jgi:hypothetical protein
LCFMLCRCRSAVEPSEADDRQKPRLLGTQRAKYKTRRTEGNLS